MGALQSPPPSATEPQGAGGSAGGLHGWPQSMVRWLFGINDERRQLESSRLSAARFQNICISREAGAGGAPSRAWSPGDWVGKPMMMS